MATAYSENDANDELWRECATWLTNWEMLRADHKANWPKACIADLANILRDGVLLCKLLNKIDPGCIDMKDISLKPTMAQFLCLRNIRVFLRACEVSFGLSKSDLFEETMLFDLTNFHKVLCTLSKLSLSAKALRGNIAGFQAQKVKTREEEVIYQSLKSVEIPTKSRNIVESCDMASEEIYQDLCNVRTTVEQQQSYEKRDFVINELLDTEKNYVDVLNKLRRNFMQPLASQMSQQDFETVFSKINELHQIHLSFYNELIKVTVDPTIKISNIFMKWRERFLTYGKYCANLTKATTTLQELCDNDEVFNQAIIKYEQEDNNGRFKLRDVLSVPMQRILKYHLLLEKLIENTDPNDEECNELRRAREAMLDVAGYINEAARDSEHLAVIKNLQDNIVEWVHEAELKLADYGRLIKDAELKIRNHDDQKTRNRYVFIFDKCILICKQLRGQQFAFREVLNIADFHVDESHNRPVLNKEARWSYNFLLVKNNSQTAYTIYVRSIELKQQIIKAIIDALDNLYPPAAKRTNHNFALKTFLTPTQCQHCSKYLKGLLFQGYRCTICGIVAHKICITLSGRCGMPPPTLKSSHSLTNGVSEPLKDKLWFVGEMDRSTAQEKLEHRENGTFLVRIRPQSDEKDKYALTLKTDNTVKHMKICCTSGDVPNYEKKYYLSQSKFFSSIEELVLNYQVNSLRENFERLEENTKLLWPYRQYQAVTLRSFESQEENKLNFHEGEVIHVVGKEGYKEGWWKGKNQHDMAGFFPAKLVRIEREVSFES